MLTYGGYPIYPTSNQHKKKKCLDFGQWYDAKLDHCPYCKNEPKK